MKYVIILGDGMSDHKIDILGNKTPLEKADKKYMDMLAKKSEVGLCATVPENLSPGSDVANLAVLGYDPNKYYSGRSPLEAVSIGVDMEDDDICFRVNLVTLSDDEKYEEKTMIDHSSGEITTAESTELLNVIKENFQSEELQFYSGVSYRHAMIQKKGSMSVDLTPPHNILEQKITNYLPKKDNSKLFTGLLKKSYDILNNHEINRKREERGLHKANSIWMWGEGVKPKLDSLESLYGIKGAMISAVDLLKGIAISAKMTSIDVEGANGGLHTNYAGKVSACLDALKNGHDLVYVHVEAPDECGHQGNALAKVQAIEYLDSKVVGPVYEGLKKMGEDFRILVMPDHPTPVELRTHTREPVPYMIFDSRVDEKGTERYTESCAESTGIFVEPGYTIMQRFLERN